MWKHVVPAALSIVVLLGCGEEQRADPTAEIEAAMNVADGAGGLLRLVALLDRDEVSWSSAEDAETSKLAAIAGSAARLPCAKVVQSGSTLRIIFGCRLLLSLEGELEVSARADFTKSPPELEVRWTLLGLGVRRFHLSGRGHVVHRQDRSRVVLGVNLKSSGVVSLAFQADGSMAVAGTAECLCVAIDGLSFGEVGAVRLAIALQGLRYCAASCPQDGEVVIAGAHLHRLRFTPQGASHSIDDAPFEPLATPLACRGR